MRKPKREEYRIVDGGHYHGFIVQNKVRFLWFSWWQNMTEAKLNGYHDERIVFCRATPEEALQALHDRNDARLCDEMRKTQRLAAAKERDKTKGVVVIDKIRL